MQAAELPIHLAAEKALLRSRTTADPYLDRVSCATETVARMRQHFRRLGITRLAEVTGLDRIGIPVWMAVRPNSKTLAVSQGKGLSDSAAQASAIMEAAEVATAERLQIPVRLASMRELAAGGGRVMPLNNLLGRGERPLAPDEPAGWVEGYDLLRECSVWVPADVVSLDPRGHDRRGSRYWQSTDGLASGNLLIEATVHGLCERIERDANVLWHFRSDDEVLDDCIDPAALQDEAVDGLARQIDSSGFRLRLFDITSDIDVPVMFSVVAPKLDGFEQHWKHFDLSAGMGAHPSPARAAIRAITEAAQSRVTSITGARDDFDPNLYGARLKADLRIYLKAFPRSSGARLPETLRDPAENLTFLLERLRTSGIVSVVVVPLEADGSGFSVAKVLVPELENPTGDRAQRFGPRALKVMRIAA
jgi:ribosomal protein S12 methylthiotransferase accessory factor